ncbi:PREDICTED: odorant receptor 30a-like [Atta cephalotes]|uniref:Odorant receptor n=1 Tax=Atta cephalotes TaxID=12957 RepID=A0A158NVE7_ATTCE|nr:PREDICTED: odorant receptor 30a-like [Atta cephalotes]
MGMTTISRLIKFGLHIYGVWPYVSSTIVFRLYWIIMLSMAQVFQYGYVIMNIHMDDFSEYMDGVSSAMTSSLLYIKLVILWTNQRIFFDVLQMMSEDWQVHTSNCYNSRIMTDMANVARRTSRWIVGMQIGSATFYSVGVLAANANSPEKLEPYARELILKMEFPFNISTDFIYATVQTVQFYHLFLVACGITIINSLLVTLSLDTPNAAAILVKSVLFYISMNVEAFIYCFCGEHLSAKSKMIGSAAYDSLWYDFSAKESQTVLFLILRSQKRLTITSGKIIDLSLERFTSVIKASLSYMSVLIAMYSR